MGDGRDQDVDSKKFGPKGTPARARRDPVCFYCPADDPFGSRPHWPNACPGIRQILCELVWESLTTFRDITDPKKAKRAIMNIIKKYMQSKKELKFGQYQAAISDSDSSSDSSDSPAKKKKKNKKKKSSKKQKKKSKKKKSSSSSSDSSSSGDDGPSGPPRTHAHAMLASPTSFNMADLGSLMKVISASSSAAPSVPSIASSEPVKEEVVPDARPKKKLKRTRAQAKSNK